MTDATRPRPPSALAELTAAIIFLTRVPLPFRGEWTADLHQRAMTWFPIVGALIGAAGGLVYWGADAAGLPPTLSALLALAALVWLTGALHEDGLADVADGFGGGRDRAAKLEIMKDSRIGTYGGVALLLAVLLRGGALATLADPRTVALALIGAHAFTRGVMPLLKLALPEARQGGVSASMGKPNSARALTAAFIGFSLGATALGQMHLDSGLHGLAVLAAATLATVLVGRLALRQIGGVTGDVLGAAQQLGEIAFLLALISVTAA
ncbi:adenosylcobinamide-GDP ribazoletransferase [Rhodospirillum centenum]|uniref:Adenosylcobinamide-GDP ribazoletransferase n=1 Tax=Rhodospirillum centenum (strain ATCC 51521 / SW) TaxID=414684 RepID=B6IPQ4_RHOCS|nr:adenosylcobinamide-GDP ribazoletransferase [Rhodospirillum centenum]ACI99756.1 cobalamin 5'-phosphate synthase [Rhodospirillum centenum SW]